MNSQIMKLLRGLRIAGYLLGRLFLILIFPVLFALVYAPQHISARYQPEPHTFGQTETQFPLLEPQQVRFDHINTKEGLAENRVWDITQDRSGFL